MKAIIMAGGEGTRLRPLTTNRPKPMVSIFAKPIMTYIIELLKKHNIFDIGITLQYMPEEIKNYYGDGSDFGVNITYFIEEMPLGTAGSVKNAEDFLDDDFIVISGDGLTDIDLSRAISFHKEKKSVATLVLYRVANPLEYGVVVTDNSGKIIRFIEKPGWSEVFSDYANTGIYILNPAILKKFNKNEIFDFSKDLFPLLLSENANLFGYLADGYWCDIGDISAYINCHYDILDNKVKINIDGNVLGQGIYIGNNCDIEKNVVIEPPVFIGNNVKIKSGAKVSAYSIVGNDCFINSYSTLEKSILWDKVSVGRSAQIFGGVVCDRVVIKDGAIVNEGAIIGDKTEVGKTSVISPLIKIWPNKKIDDATQVNANLIWGAKYTKELFSKMGITGEINIDITPEFASRLGAAVGSLFRGKKFGISCDDKKPSKMLKNSFISGLLSSGVLVYDLGQNIISATRMATRFYGLFGATHIETYDDVQKNNLVISFLDKYGANIKRSDERKIESIFIREDFVRTEPCDIPEITVTENYNSFYEREIINSIKNKKIDKTIAIEGNSKLPCDTLYNILTEIGCSAYFSNTYTKGFDEIGAIINENGSEIILIDESGRLINNEKYFLISTYVLLKNNSDRELFVPISAPSVTDNIAKSFNTKITRTKTAKHDIMQSIMENNDVEQFLMYFDNIFSFVKILEYLKKENISLSDLYNEIPKFYMSFKDVDCKFEYKGRVIRELINQNSDNKMELKEGVKLFLKGGWALIIPDNEKPVCRIITEGYSEEYANEIATFFEANVKNIIKNS